MSGTCRPVGDVRSALKRAMLALAMLCLPHVAGAQARAEASAAAEAEVELVPQQAGIATIGAWTHDDRFVVTVGTLPDMIVVWDAASAAVVNRIPLPQFEAGSAIILQRIVIDGANDIAIHASLRDDAGDDCTALVMTMPLARPGNWDVAEADTAGNCIAAETPPAPVRSHDRRYRLSLAGWQARIEDRKGRIVHRLEKPEPTMPFAAALSPDGKRIAMITVGDEDNESAGGVWRSAVTVFDLAAWRTSAYYLVEGYYADVRWLDDDRLLLPGAVQGGRFNKMAEPPSATRIVSALTGAQLGAPIDFRCGTMALPGGMLVGSATANCTFGADGAGGLERYDPAGGWQSFGPADFAGRRIDHLGITPDGKRLIVTASAPPQAVPDMAVAPPTISAIDVRTGRLIAQAPLPAPDPQIDYAPDSALVGIRLASGNYRWDMSAAAPVALAETEPPVAVLASQTVNGDGTRWHERTFDTTSAPIWAVRIVDGRKVAWPYFDNVLAEGALPGSPLRWTVTSLDGLVVWLPNRDDPFQSTIVLRTTLVDARHFLSYTPEGRYDTNLGADSGHIRWLVSDAPLQSLGPQTFMRNFFEPRLGPQLIACVPAGDCDARLRPITAVARLNRVLPQVRIARIVPGPTPDLAMVDVEVRSARRTDTPNGRNASDAYDLRLFRDGSLVAQTPGAQPDALDFDIGQWRRDNRVVPGRNGVARARFTVRLPSGADPVEFTAYAFNEDRVKSETARQSFARPDGPRVPGRVFVVALGVDAYAEPRLRLNFAAGDARLIGERLATLPDGGATRRLVLADDGRPGGAKITRAIVADVFGILGGAPREPALARLAAHGIDAAMLDAAGPDDAVIIAFSGHGWADPNGNFYLLPAEARWPDPDQPPDLATLVSTADMSRLLRSIDAGEMALIIDACHSAASIAARGFRAGPMGDAGLGQLAFDKRMRILAATQADDIALESATLGQGLLTFALASEGLTAAGGMADENGDGAITLDEWLAYATRRLPGLSREVRGGRLAAAPAGARGVVFLDDGSAPGRVQEPALFEFTGSTSRLVLRKVPR